MMNDTTGKELILTPPADEVVQRSKPTLIQVGDRSISSDGRYHHHLAVEYLITNRSRWMPIGELARVFYGGALIYNKTRVRRRLSDLFVRFLQRGELLVVEYNTTTGQAMAVKLYDPRSEQDRQAIRPRLERMEKRKQLTASLFDRACELVAQYESAAQAPA